MVNHFSPGGTRFNRRERRNRCLWRENSFLLYLLRMAVNATMDLRSCLEHWDQISLDLREAPRKRILQIEDLELKAPLLT